MYGGLTYFLQDVSFFLTEAGEHSKTVKYLNSPPGGIEPPTFRLTAERANRLRHRGPEQSAFHWQNKGCSCSE